MQGRFIVDGARNAGASVRLFCFPYAGAGGSSFRKLKEQLGRSVDVVRLQLPGREERLSEPPRDDMETLVQDLVHELEPWVRGRSVFLGYSLGALLAFEAARALQRGARPLQQLIACACAAPSTIQGGVALDDTDDALLRRLRSLGGTPAKLLDDRAAMAVLLPAIRADFRLVDRYRYTRGPLLRCPIRALGGEHDPTVAPGELSAWRQHTSGHFEASPVPGHHFFMHGSADRFRDLVLTCLGIAEPTTALVQQPL